MYVKENWVIKGPKKQLGEIITGWYTLCVSEFCSFRIWYETNRFP